MRLVERVARERHEDVPHRLRGLLGVAVLLHARKERDLLAGQHLGLLLAHRAAQHVRLAQRIARQDARGRLHLLLVHDQAVRLVEHLLERFGHLGVDRRDLLQAVLAFGVVVVRVHIHRARTVQGDQRGDVVEVVRLEALEQGAHAVRIQLEHAQRVAARQQLVRPPVVERDLRVVDRLLAVGGDVLQRVADHREVGQAQEVHLHQAQRLARMVLERRRDRPVRALQQGRRVRDRLRAHDRGARMHTRLADQALDAHRLIGDALGVRVRLVQLAELTRLGVALGLRVEDVVQRHVLAAGGGRWQRLGDLLAHRELVAHDARRVLERLLRLDRAVDHALRDLVMPVLLTAVVDDLQPALRVEIHIDVRQAHTLGVEEPLEDQAMLQRVELRDAHRVRDHRTRRRTTPRADHDPMVLGPLDVIRHHQEVARELHLADHTALVIRLLEHMVGHVAVIAPLQALLYLPQEQRGLVPTLGARELRHERAVLVVVEHHVAPLRHLQRVVTCLGQVTEQLPHLLGRPHVIALAIELEPPRLIKLGPRIDAQHRILRAGVLLVHVVRVVRGEQGRAEPFGDVEQVVRHAALDLEPMVHQFDVEVLLAVDVLQFAGGAQRLVELPQAQARLHDARRAARPADHALAVRGEHVLVHARIAHHTALEVRHRRRFRQVDQALVTLRPQCQMGIEATTRHVIASLRLGAPVHTRLVAARRLRRHIRFDAQDRLDALLDRLAPQLIRAMHVAMVRDADRRHAQVLGAPDQIRDLRSAVKQRIMRVVMQLNKVCGLSHKVQIYPFRMTVRKGPRHRLRAMRMVRRVAWRHAVRAVHAQARARFASCKALR